MKMRSLLMGLLIAASAQGGATAARAETVMLVDIKLPIKKAGTTSDVPANTIAEIKVDGSRQKGPYDSVQTKSLDYIIAARGERHKKLIGPLFILKLDGHGDGGGYVNEDWKYFALTRDYIDPRATGIEGRRVSPIDLCNDKMSATKGAARTTFLKNGATFIHKDAYEVTGEVSVDTFSGPTPMIEESETIQVPVRINCMPLDRRRPRENSETKGPPPREGREMAPTIKKATLRIASAHVVQDGKFLCPTELKLHGYMETIREFHGKSIFVGPRYLSALTMLNLQAAGSRHATATYKMDWHRMGGLSTAPNAEPKKQKLTFQFNIATKDGELLKSAVETVEVSCKKITVAVPSVSDDMTVKPAN